MKSVVVAAAILLTTAALAVAPEVKPPATRIPKSKLAYVLNGDIWTANGAGAGARLVIPNAEAPAWSPDKRQIAFVRDENIWVANADGSAQRKLTSRWHKAESDYGDPNAHAQGRNVDLSWDPKSDWIAFSHWEKVRAIRAGEKRGRLILCSLVPLLY